MQEYDDLERAKALSLAEAKDREEAAALETKAMVQAIQWNCEQAEQERALKRDQERAGLEAAHNLANEDGSFDEQARLEGEYEAAATGEAVLCSSARIPTQSQQPPSASGRAGSGAAPMAVFATARGEPRAVSM